MLYVFVMFIFALAVNRHDCYSWRDDWISRPAVHEEEDGGGFCRPSDFEVSTITQSVQLALLTQDGSRDVVSVSTSWSQDCLTNVSSRTKFPASRSRLGLCSKGLVHIPG